MKSVLFFNPDGIYEQRITNKTHFNIEDYSDFNAYKEYSGYYILYNTISIENNIIILPFTTERFNGSILIN